MRTLKFFKAYASAYNKLQVFLELCFSLIPSGNKRSFINKSPGLSNMYDLLVPPGIKGLKLT